MKAWYAVLLVSGLAVMYVVGAFLAIVAIVAVVNGQYCTTPHESAISWLRVVVPLCGLGIASVAVLWGHLSRRYRRTAIVWRVAAALVLVLTLVVLLLNWNGSQYCGRGFLQ